jgi:hypothetical protein
MDTPRFPWPSQLPPEERLTYRATPRTKPKFKSFLDAADLFPTAGSESTVVTRLEGEELVLELDHTLLRGRMVEEARFALDGGIAVQDFTRLGYDTEGNECRREKVDFLRGPVSLPRATYPEVLLPFLMRALPQEGMHGAWAWINDRMVARLYIEARGTSKLTVPAGRFTVREMWMYPDLNDWIALGSIVTKLAKPLLPRYHIWLETGGTHRVVAFEGPYGPPGGPEVRFELAG